MDNPFALRRSRAWAVAAMIVLVLQWRVNASIFADLADGKSYGDFGVAPGNSSDILSFNLSPDAIADINAIVDLGSGYFSLGGADAHGL